MEPCSTCRCQFYVEAWKGATIYISIGGFQPTWSAQDIVIKKSEVRLSLSETGVFLGEVSNHQKKYNIFWVKYKIIRREICLNLGLSPSGPCPMLGIM